MLNCPEIIKCNSHTACIRVVCINYQLVLFRPTVFTAVIIRFVLFQRLVYLIQSDTEMQPHGNGSQDIWQVVVTYQSRLHISRRPVRSQPTHFQERIERLVVSRFPVSQRNTLHIRFLLYITLNSHIHQIQIHHIQETELMPGNQIII